MTTKRSTRGYITSPEVTERLKFLAKSRGVTYDAIGDYIHSHYMRRKPSRQAISELLSNRASLSEYKMKELAYAIGVTDAEMQELIDLHRKTVRLVQTLNR